MSATGEAIQISMKDGQIVHRVHAHDGSAFDCAYSPDGSVFATVGEDGDVAMWESRSGSALARLSSHAAPVVTCAFSPDGSLLATGDKSGTVNVWDLLPVMEVDEGGKKKCTIS